VPRKHISLEVAPDYVATVTLNRPPVNALGRDLRTEFVSTFEELHDRADVRAIILTGQGHVFCAGADIKEKRGESDAPGTQAHADRLIRDAFLCLLECRKPVIAAINGAALGAGMVMATCCDVIIAAEHAVFAMPEIDVGLGGGASFLQRVMPPQALRWMLLSGERVPAVELHRLGIVKECVSGERLMDVATERARQIAAKSPLAVATAKQSIGSVENLPLYEAFRSEQHAIAALRRSEDAKEAQLAFIEKRRPVFTGR
jgi:enoyl-CoA hydratase